MPDAPPPAVAAARRLLDALVALGVRHVVVAPGSRSAPLATAAADLADAGALTLHVRLDERDAGFVALGLARGAAPAAPVAVVTTSGTAVANLHPAVLEAHHAGVPLLLLTADRPHELRGTGANQTTDQVGLFAGTTRLTVDVPAPDVRPGELDDLDHLAARAVDAACGQRSGHPGPVHLDLAYRDPLVAGAGARAGARAGGGAGGGSGAAAGAGAELSALRVAGVSTGSLARPPLVVPVPAVTNLALPSALAHDVVETVVVAGDGAGPLARALAEARGWPLLAEPSSGACGGPTAVAAHPLVLAVLGERVRRVVVLGRPTLSRPVQQLLSGALAVAGASGEAPVVEVVVVAPGSAPWPDAARNASVVLPAVPAAWLTPARQNEPAAASVPASSSADAARAADAARGDWSATWRAASFAARGAVHEHVDGRSDRRADDGTDGGAPPALDGLTVAAEVAAASRAQDVLVVGSSSPVRDLDLVAAWDEPPVVVANRGLAGIDGLVATASGVALAVGDRPADGRSDGPAGESDATASSARRVRAYLGDLTFLHDVGGLLRLATEPEPDLQIVVANDGGGSIFSTLEPGDALRVPATTFERVFATPHDVDLAALCAAYRVGHVRVTTRAELAAALVERPRGTVVIEALVDRAHRRDDGLSLAESVRSAVREVTGS